jgi:hypothetical protein
MRRDLRRTVAIAAALFVVVLWAATSAPTRVWERPDAGEPLTPATIPVGAPSITFVPPIPVFDGEEDDDASEAAWQILQTVLLGALFVMIVGAGYLLRGLVFRYIRRDEDDEERFPVLPDVTTVMAEDAEAQFTALASGSPRNAIVACWIRLEEAVASAGVHPRPADTPAELTARVLAAHAVARDAIDELAALYREARFSTHELGERQRTEAVEALRRLHADLTPRHVDVGAS